MKLWNKCWCTGMATHLNKFQCNVKILMNIPTEYAVTRSLINTFWCVVFGLIYEQMFSHSLDTWSSSYLIHGLLSSVSLCLNFAWMSCCTVHIGSSYRHGLLVHVYPECTSGQRSSDRCDIQSLWRTVNDCQECEHLDVVFV